MMTSSNGNIFRVTGHLCSEFTSPRWIPRTKAFDVFFDLRLNKRLSKQWQGWWFETPSCQLWRHCNVNTVKKWNNLSMPKLQRCKSKQKHNENDVTTFPNWGTSDSTTGKNDSPEDNSAPKFMNSAVSVVGSRQVRSGCYGHFKFGTRNILQHACPPRAILLTHYGFLYHSKNWLNMLCIKF